MCCQKSSSIHTLMSNDKQVGYVLHQENSSNVQLLFFVSCVLDKLCLFGFLVYSSTLHVSVIREIQINQTGI